LERRLREVGWHGQRSAKLAIVPMFVYLIHRSVEVLRRAMLETSEHWPAEMAKERMRSCQG
jgi:hypothetical protein